MKKSLHYRIMRYLLFLAILVVSFSCKDKASEIGADLLPSSDRLSVISDSTTNLKFKSDTEINSVLTFQLLYDGYGSIVQEFPVNIIGDYYSPIYGNVKAGFLVQLSLIKKIPVIDTTTAVANSMVLYLVNNKIELGDKELNYTVYTIDTLLNYKEYSSDINISKISKNIVGSGEINSKDSLLKIEITDIKLLNKILKTNTSEFKNDSFNININFFKGLYIEFERKDTSIQNVENGLLLSIKTDNVYFNKKSNKNKLNFYYTYKDTTILQDTAIFFISDYCAKVTSFTHNYDNSYVKDTNYVVLQGLAGSCGLINFDNFYNTWKWNDVIKSKIIINNAEIILEPSSLNDSTDFPAFDFLYRIFEDNKYKYSNINEANPSGKIIQLGLNKFTLSNYLNLLIQGKLKSADIILRVSNSAINPKSVVFDSKNIKLKFTYTKL